MAISLKKIMAALLAAAVMLAAIPTVSILASGVDEIAENDDADTTAVDESDAAEEQVDETPADKPDESEMITLADYEMVYENDDYEMWYYEPRLSVVLVNKETGKLFKTTLMDEDDDYTSNSTWEAYMKSGIVITAIVGTNSGNQVDMISVSNEISTRSISNGIEATIYWESYGFRVVVQITLEGDELVVNVPDDYIDEEKANASLNPSYISQIVLFPMMGYTYMDEEDGYMLIPDGNGALIYLDDKEGRYSTGFSQMIYGSDAGFRDSSSITLLWDKYDIVDETNEVLAPIFGMAHLDEQMGYLAVVEKGATRAEIDAHPNGAIINYNRCYALFTLRLTYLQPLNNTNSGSVTQVEADRTHTDHSVRYILLTGEDATYSGMANAYRDYLIEHGEVNTKADTSYNTRVDFLGTDRESFMFGTRAVAMTTVDNVEEIYNELQLRGVNSLITVYKGWQKGGLYNLPITKYKADGKIGGTRDLTNLITTASKSNYEVYLYNDAIDMNASTNMSTFSAMKMVNKRTFSYDTYMQIYDTFYYLMPTKTSSNLSKFVKSYTNKGVSNVALAGITNNLFSYSSQGSFYTRQDTADDYEKAISSIRDNVNLIMEQPAAYLWKYTDAFLDMPLGDSDFMYAEDEIPFLSMVLKGVIPMYSEYVNFEANKSEFFLQMVEAGVYPSFYLTYENSSALIYTNSSDLYSTEYATYKDTVVEYDEELRALAKQTENSYIVKHEILEDGIRKVTYDNGVVIYVNYTDNEYSVDGITVGAMSYKVGEAE